MTITLYSYDELIALDLPEPEYVVAGMFAKGNAVILNAREKSGKGFLMLDVAISIALGQPFLGREVKQGPVIYLALEESLQTIRDRLRSRAGGATGFPVYTAPLDGSHGESFQLDNPGSVQDLMTIVKKHRPAMIVIDTLREAHTGRENESDDMTDLIRPIRMVAHETNTCIVVTHHSSKAGGPRGSTSIPAAFDDVFVFVRDDLDTDTDMRGVLTGKGRDLPKLIQYIAFDPETHRWITSESAPILNTALNLRERIVQVLNSTEDWLTAEGIANRLPDTKLQTVRNKLSDMIRERPRQMMVEGSGSKGDPRKYHGIHKREDIDTDSSGNDPGTIGSNGHHERVCPLRRLHCRRAALLSRPCRQNRQSSVG